MKAILMSIKPKWCEKIFSGKKDHRGAQDCTEVGNAVKEYAYQTKNRGGENIINDCLDSFYCGCRGWD